MLTYVYEPSSRAHSHGSGIVTMFKCQKRHTVHNSETNQEWLTRAGAQVKQWVTSVDKGAIGLKTAMTYAKLKFIRCVDEQSEEERLARLMGGSRAGDDGLSK